MKFYIKAFNKLYSIIILISALKLKNGVDKADLEKGIKLPCILIENKIDLLKEDNEKDSNELEEFSKKNGFDGCFRTSAKTGKNINEALNYLICDIIKRRDNIKLTY